MHPVTQISLEWFLASGNKTIDRLRDICRHIATSKGYDDPEPFIQEAKSNLANRYPWAA